MDQDLLIRNGFIEIPSTPGGSVDAILFAPIGVEMMAVATVVSNLAYYGFGVDRVAFDALITAPDLGQWWKSVSPTLKAITGTDRQMDKHVVFKNFPREVLEMSRAESLIKQLLIYFGVPYDHLREVEQEREPLGDIKRLKILSLADENTENHIFNNLVEMRNRWSDNQTEWAKRLIGSHNAIVCGEFGFKDNAIVLAAANFENKEFVPSSATDVIRLAAGLSEADITLRSKVKFRHFKRPERQRLLTALESCSNIAEDMASRPGQWKRLMEHLRPGDYKQFGAVSAAYDTLYNRTVKPFSAILDPQMPDMATLVAASTRPGEFLRRFHHYYGVFGHFAIERFIPVMDKLTTRQLANFRAYLRTINSRRYMMYAPRGNWGRVQIADNQKTKIEDVDRLALDNRIKTILSERLAVAFPNGLLVDDRVDRIRLQGNDQKLAEYGRGTEFDIPTEMTFLRTASYWEADRNRGVTWYDNGWNFYDHNWSDAGCCSWNDQMRGGDKAAVFSGDPVNTKDLRGRACQMIDLYLDALARRGVRYGVWNVLCYSKVKFSDAKEVLATLQMGEHPEKGKLYEPSRAQMVFPIRSETYTSYVAYLDVERRKIVYMDADLPMAVMSASYNSDKLAGYMPAYLEYLASQPTLMDILQDAPAGEMPVLYEDSNRSVTGRAYVFNPVNPDNHFDRVSLTDLINV